MDGRVDDEPDFWMEEPEELPSFPMKKRKVRTKKMEFVGWGSKPLIEFLESIGKDTSKQISQYEVAAIIDEYVKTNNLTHPQKKKRILCDGRLHSLFGRKSVGRIKIYDLLETHFAENQDESEDNFFYSSEENDEKTMSKQKKALRSDKKNLQQRKKVPETPKSCFAAITSANLKLVYLKRSLVQDLLKDPETFEGKVVGSFVRVKSDPNDYFQKNSHQLLQVAGVTKASGPDNTGIEILLQVSNWMQDIRICMLSEVNFSEEECEDLHERVKSGSLKRPTVVEFQQKAEMLHEDITKHWLVRELKLLQNLIDRANEKGWRKAFTLFEYLERKELLQTPAEQTKLLVEVPKVVADEIEQEATPQEGSHGSPRSTRGVASDTSANDSEANQALSTNDVTDAAVPESADVVITSKVIFHDSSLAKEENCDSISVDASNREAEEDQHAQCERTQSLNLEESKDSWGWVDKHVVPAEVVELSDDDDKEDEDSGGGGQITGDHPRSMWHYVDPRGNVQGPFSIELLKRWRDANYFPPDFKVWKPGQSQDEAVFLSDVLLQTFPNSLQLREYI